MLRTLTHLVLDEVMATDGELLSAALLWSRGGQGADGLVFRDLVKASADVYTYRTPDAAPPPTRRTRTSVRVFLEP